MSWSSGQELSKRNRVIAHPSRGPCGLSALHTPPEGPVAPSALLSIHVNISEATEQSKIRMVCDLGHTRKKEILSSRLLNGCHMSSSSPSFLKRRFGTECVSRGSHLVPLLGEETEALLIPGQCDTEPGTLPFCALTLSSAYGSDLQSRRDYVSQVNAAPSSPLRSVSPTPMSPPPSSVLKLGLGSGESNSNQSRRTVIRQAAGM